MIVGLLLCWIAGAYWKKIYYVYITFVEILIILFCGLGATVGEEGDYTPVSGFTVFMLMLLVVLLIIILISYGFNKRMADALNMFVVMMIAMIEYTGFITDSKWGLLPVFILVFLLISIFAAILVYWSDSYSAVAPSSAFAVTWGMALKVFDTEAINESEFFLGKGWKGSLVFWGIMIILTVAGCMIQLLILKKTEMGTKKRHKLSEALK